MDMKLVDFTTADMPFDSGVRRKNIKYFLEVSRLEEGMHIVQLDIPWEESPFLYHGFTIESRDDIALVSSVCEYVYVEAIEQAWEEVSGNSVSNRRKITFVKNDKGFLKNNYNNRSYIEVRSHLEFMFKTMSLSRNFFNFQSDTIVTDCVLDIIRNPNVISIITRIRQDDDDVFRHSINVMVFSVALGRELGMLPFELKNLGMCALLHDIGKITIPASIKNKPGKLTAEERSIMEGHTAAGRKILTNYGASIYLGAVDVAYNHHEKLDGTGYPRGIDSTKISLFTRIVTIADVYDAMTSKRSYHDPISSMAALKYIKSGIGTHFDEDISNQFINMIGCCPPGYIVEMDTGDFGIVLKNRERGLTPKVLLISHDNGLPIKEEVVDLSNQAGNSELKRINVLNDYRSGMFGIDVKEYIDRGLRIDGVTY